jgi:hypothetical protein
VFTGAGSYRVQRFLLPVVGSQGVLRRLEVCVEQLRVDWRDVIMAAEYKLKGRKLDGGSNYERVYDFNRPIEEASVTDRS